MIRGITLIRGWVRGATSEKGPEPDDGNRENTVPPGTTPRSRQLLRFLSSHPDRSVALHRGLLGRAMTQNDAGSGRAATMDGEEDAGPLPLRALGLGPAVLRLKPDARLGAGGRVLRPKSAPDPTQKWASAT